jgi:hypothetical protein
MRKTSLVISILLAAGLAGVWRGISFLHLQTALASTAAGTRRTYATGFPLAENLISERGN